LHEILNLNDVSVGNKISDFYITEDAKNCTN